MGGFVFLIMLCFGLHKTFQNFERVNKDKNFVLDVLQT